MSQPIDVYLLAGQSNMSGKGEPEQVPDALREPHPHALLYFAPLDPPDSERYERANTRHWTSLQPGAGSPIGGFGPELSFGHTMAAHSKNPVAIIKSEKGGSSLFTDWAPDLRDKPTTFTNRCLNDAADAIESLLEDGYDPRFAGFVWYQGESETLETTVQPERYGEKLRLLLDRISNEIADGQTFSKVLFRVHPHMPRHKPNYDLVRKHLVETADADSLGAWVDVDDLNYPDDLHPDGPSLLIAGDRAATAMLQLQGIDVQTDAATAHPLPTPPPAAGVGHPADHPKPEDDASVQVNPQSDEHLGDDVEDAFSSGVGDTKPQPSKHKPLPKPDKTRIIALMNQKGGVGKTTTAVNVGAALSHLGLNVLCIDLDPQAHLTLSLGLEPDDIDKSNYDLLTDPATSAMEVVRQLKENQNLAVLPAETNLAGVESELAEMVSTGLAQTILRNKCKDLIQQFDYVLIDCPPSLGLLTINALTLAHEIVVPMQAHFLALQGMTKLFETIGMVRQGINPELTVAGVVLCMHEGNTLLAGEVIGELNGFFEQARGTDQPWANGRVFDPPVRRNIKLAEAPSFGQSVLTYAADSNGAKDYLKLARSIASGP